MFLSLLQKYPSNQVGIRNEVIIELPVLNDTKGEPCPACSGLDDIQNLFDTIH